MPDAYAVCRVLSHHPDLPAAIPGQTLVILERGQPPCLVTSVSLTPDQVVHLLSAGILAPAAPVQPPAPAPRLLVI